MKRTTLRVAGVSALAAVAFGIAAPAASAATAAPVRTVAVVQTADVQQSTGSLSVVSTAGNTAAPATGGPANGEAAQANVGRLVKAAWEAIKKSGLAKKAWEAAKKGQTGFTNWVNSLSNWNPAKWAIKAVPGYAMQELISYILNNYTG
ncbi:hypothetical protein ACFWUZ_35795 [Streptomyces sp. NPDC058646]|uniref:hypothetical protein n=1 Tax=Streptomyces sp. NPDC058646 TaxID=3346574 RepID=UPI0036653F09